MPATPRDLLDRFQQAMLDFSADALADLFADEAIYEFVFWTPHRGPSQRYDGREEIRVGFRAAWGSVSKPPLTGFGEVCVHETADPEVIISEGEMDGVNHATGRPFTSRFVLVLRARDGRIVHLRDYSDVLRTAAGLGRLTPLFDQVRAESAP
ncbi:nuclear transport factor 2 family protein [Microbispora rosea]|uniref:nuclear transport factor 2 family protein n=1 Tax=Microbispora rosea TaxID=58117 RepID=UPI0004C39167|nr:nuclear transport factor 2 family protein [Microbispora rosea]